MTFSSVSGHVQRNWKAGLNVALISLPLSLSLAVASNATPDGRAENRRVELHIVPNDELKKEDTANPGG